VVVLAGSHDNGRSRSEDGDRTWSRVDAGLNASDFRFLAPDPWHPERCWPVPSRRGSHRLRAPGRSSRLLAAVEVAGLLRSDNDGRS